MPLPLPPPTSPLGLLPSPTDVTPVLRVCYFAGEERVDFFLALRGQTPGQMIEVVFFLDDGRPVEVVGQSDGVQQVTVFADQTRSTRTSAN